MEELLRLERLREEVRRVLVGGHEGHHDLHVLDALADKEVAAFDVLHPRPEGHTTQVHTEYTSV